MNRDEVASWVARAEEAWRTPGSQLWETLHRRCPLPAVAWAEPIAGMAALRAFWEVERKERRALRVDERTAPASRNGPSGRQPMGTQVQRAGVITMPQSRRDLLAAQHAADGAERLGDGGHEPVLAFTSREMARTRRPHDGSCGVGRRRPLVTRPRASQGWTVTVRCGPGASPCLTRTGPAPDPAPSRPTTHTAWPPGCRPAERGEQHVLGRTELHGATVPASRTACEEGAAPASRATRRRPGGAVARRGWWEGWARPRCVRPRARIGSPVAERVGQRAVSTSENPKG